MFLHRTIGTCLCDCRLQSGILPHVRARAPCLQAQHPPYMLPPEYAQMAREVMNAALAAGLTPHKHVWASLMDAQVRGLQAAPCLEEARGCLLRYTALML